MTAAAIDPILEARYIEEVAAPCVNDPWAWIQTAYPWGCEGTILEDREPHPWHETVSKLITKELKAAASGKKSMQPIQIAVKSGHGVGKSAFIGMLNDWNLATMSDARGITSANTFTQLTTKTWPELNKWHKLSISESFFTWTAQTLHANSPGQEKNWACTATPWSERNYEAFQGLHNAGKRVLVVFDEASGIPTKIWEAIMGAMTDKDTQVIWLAFGNPTRGSGPFYACWHKYKKLWHTFTLDSRDVPGTNLELFAQWAEVYGEDSDFFKIRVRGLFPDISALQFISRENVEIAMGLKAEARWDDPLICGIDIARRGECNSVLFWRKGRDGQSIKPDIYPDDPNSETFVAKCAGRLKDMQPDLIYGDSVGVGGPILDRLRGLGFDVVDVIGGRPAVDNLAHFNRRAEMWFKGKMWIRDGGALWDDEGLADELCMIELVPNPSGRTQMESKESLLDRGESSPDVADAFMNTFAYEYSESVSAEEARHSPHRDAEQDFDQWAELDPVSEQDDFDPTVRNRQRQMEYMRGGKFYKRKREEE